MCEHTHVHKLVGCGHLAGGVSLSSFQGDLRRAHGCFVYKRLCRQAWSAHTCEFVFHPSAQMDGSAVCVGLLCVHMYSRHAPAGGEVHVYVSQYSVHTVSEAQTCRAKSCTPCDPVFYPHILQVGIGLVCFLLLW